MQLVLNVVDSQGEPRLVWHHVSKFLCLRDRFCLVQTCRCLFGLLSSSMVWKWNCEFLEDEFGVFCPEETDGSWKERFLKMYKCRGLFAENGADQAKASIQVFARLRPGASLVGLGAERVTLPLYQRIALLKASGKAVTTSECIQLLADSGEWFRGAGQGDQLASFEFKIQSCEDRQIIMTTPAGVESFLLDKVFLQGTEQEQVYQSVCKDVVGDVLNGTNATLFGYGQTGSGKTHTMFGGCDDLRGLVPRVCEELFASTQRRSKKGISSRIHATYLEILGDRISDLFRQGQQVGSSRVAAQRIAVEGKASVEVCDLSHLNELLLQAEQWKSKGCTRMNEASTRAHTLLLFRVSQEREKQVESVLILADLCGSERLKKSQAQGEQLDEVKEINRGLHALHRVVLALKESHGFIPYSSSKLTQVLSAGLGGVVRVVVCVNPHPTHSSETLQALRFAGDCCAFPTRGVHALGSVLKLVKALEQEMAALQDLIRDKERWETTRTTRVDPLSGCQETLSVTTLQGAEREHAMLVKLAAKRMALLGLKS